MKTTHKAEGSAMPDDSTDHTSEARRYVDKGLSLVRKGDIDSAIEAFVHAAVAFERSQDFRQISGLWEAIGKMLEPSFKGDTSEWLDPLQEGEVQLIYDKWYQWPLEYGTISWNTWKNKTELVHRQAWAYQWAAKHRERAGDSITAYRLFLRAAEKAERTTNREKYPHWPANLYHSAVLNYIRAFGTVNDKEVEKAIRSMKDLYLDGEESAKAHRSLAIAYRLLKSNLIEAGNLTEAEQFKSKERSELALYYFHSKNYLGGILEWLAGSGFKYFILAMFVMILFVFPIIYYQWNLIIPVWSNLTPSAAIIYSLESAIGAGHTGFYVVGSGKLLEILERALSWLGLGVFIWWLTRRLE